MLTDDGEPLNYYRVVHALNEVLDPDASIVTHDAGAPRDCMVPFYRATVPHSYVGWGKTTHLGFGLPLAIGAKVAQPDKFCLNVMGDGAFGMSGLDLETAVRAELPITTVLLNNGAMATYAGARDMIAGRRRVPSGCRRWAATTPRSRTRSAPAASPCAARRSWSRRWPTRNA